MKKRKASGLAVGIVILVVVVILILLGVLAFNPQAVCDYVPMMPVIC